VLPELVRHPTRQTHYDHDWTVLGEVLAVPCNPQSALAGLNSLSRGSKPKVSALSVALMVRSRRDGDP
jgi:hypothetical protein